jgi:hypothetical protein
MLFRIKTLKLKVFWHRQEISVKTKGKSLPFLGNLIEKGMTYFDDDDSLIEASRR